MKYNKKKLIITTVVMEFVILICLFLFSGIYIQHHLEKDLQNDMLSIARYAAPGIYAPGLKLIYNGTFISVLVPLFDRDKVVAALIVKCLKNLARLDEGAFKKANINEGMESALALIQHELTDRIEVIKE